MPFLIKHSLTDEMIPPGTGSSQVPHPLTRKLDTDTGKVNVWNLPNYSMKHQKKKSATSATSIDNNNACNPLSTSLLLFRGRGGQRRDESGKDTSWLIITEFLDSFTEEGAFQKVLFMTLKSCKYAVCTKENCTVSYCLFEWTVPPHPKLLCYNLVTKCVSALFSTNSPRLLFDLWVLCMKRALNDLRYFNIFAKSDF